MDGQDRNGGLDELSTLDAEPPESARGPGELGVGDRIAGKYAIAGLLGSGGMGAVYLAHDERLARDVAIKIGLTTGASALARAEREAQVLAQLSHPNVVVIFEVGEHASRLFVAMEHVGGGTARAWLAAKPRSWREIVELYAGAGAGLAAAHAAGIVHRDFKPDNVLVGDDGRPRVADFGLARAGASVTTPEPIDDDEPVASAMSDRLTRTGVAVGTPAYMAPEQLAPGRAAVDAWSDQFSFCVALWEALHGVRPFIGADRAELRAAMRVAPKPASSSVPRYVTAALTRGLAVDPAARWPSLGVLVARLRRGRSRRTLSLGLGLGVAAVLTAVLAPAAALRSDDPCDSISAELATAWTPARELALSSALGDAGGATAWPAIDTRLRGYASGWLDADRAACHAARDGGESAAMIDRRVACIAASRTRLAAVVDAIAAGGKPAVTAALAELDSLPPHGECTDLESLSYRAPPPTDAFGRTTAVAIDTALARAESRRLRGDVDAPSVAEIGVLEVASHATRWPVLEPTANRLAAMLDLDRGSLADGRTEIEAVATAFVAAGDDFAAVRAMLVLANSFDDTGATVDAERWSHLAEGLVHRLHDPPELLGMLARTFARTREAGYGPGMRDAAVLRLQAAELGELAGGDTLARALARLDRAMAIVDHDGVARRELIPGRRELAEIVGDDHPALIAFDLVLARADLGGHATDADAEARRAIASITHWYGGADVRLVEPSISLSRALVQQQRPSDAVAVLVVVGGLVDHAAPRVRAQFHVAYAEALASNFDRIGAATELARAKSEYANFATTLPSERVQLAELDRALAN